MKSPMLNIPQTAVAEQRGTYTRGHVSSGIIEMLAAASDNHAWVVNLLEVQLMEDLAAALTVRLLSGRTVAATAAGTGTEAFTKTAHGLATGDQVRVTTDATITGISSGDIANVIRTDADTFKLATSQANALAGTAADVTAAGTSWSFEAVAHTLHFGAAQADGDSKGLAVAALPLAAGAKARVHVVNSGSKNFLLNFGAYLAK
jgi:hypothetical protein